MQYTPTTWRMIDHGRGVLHTPALHTPALQFAVALL